LSFARVTHASLASLVQVEEIDVGLIEKRDFAVFELGVQLAGDSGGGMRWYELAKLSKNTDLCLWLVYFSHCRFISGIGGQAFQFLENPMGWL